MTTDPAPSATPTTPSTQVRELGLFLAVTYAIALAIALALPRADLAPLVTIFAPVLAVAITTVTVIPTARAAPRRPPTDHPRQQRTRALSGCRRSRVRNLHLPG